MNEQIQSLCFLAGANSIFYGCKLLTTSNPETHEDVQLFNKLGINSEKTRSHSDEAYEQSLTQQIDEHQQSSKKPLYIDASISSMNK